MARAEASPVVRVAAVDIGTNTVRLLVADVAEPGLFPHRVAWLDRRSIVARLGQGVDATGVLAEDAIVRTIDILTGYGDAIRTWECAGVRAVATSATRDAANRDEFLDRAALALGVRPETISGDEEAALSFAGSTAGIDGEGPVLVIDPGGGSTEFVLGEQRPDYSVSTQIGSVRLTERSLPDRPASPDQLAAARTAADDVFRSVTLPRRPATVVGVGGTYTALAAIWLDLPEYDSDRVHRTELTPADLHELADHLATLTLEEIEAIPSLDPARAPVLLGGAVVAERALVHVGAGTVVVSEHDIMDGICLSIAGG